MSKKFDQNYYFNKITRVIGFDDSPFTRNEKNTWIIGVLMRADYTVEKVMKAKIEVDGNDSIEAIISIYKKIGNGVRMLMLQGSTFGGFNIVDIDELFRLTSIPVAVVIDRMPDMEKIKEALVGHFNDWEFRLKKLGKDIYFDSGIYYQFSGINKTYGIKFIKRFIRNGKTPEPLRLANLIASII